MKKLLLSLIGVAALLATITVQAQIPTAAANTIYSNFLIPAGVTTNLPSPYFIDCSKQQNMAIQSEASWSIIATPAGTLTNLVFTLAPTVDGVKMDTNQSKFISQSDLNGPAGSINVLATNLNAQGLKGYFLIAIQNNHATGVATNTLKQFIKISAP